MSNCWAVLGIEPTEEQKAIRLAYVQGLKRCHPEEDPEGFQALREAFEEARQLAERGLALESGEDAEERAFADWLARQSEFVQRTEALYRQPQQRFDPEVWRAHLAGIDTLDLEERLHLGADLFQWLLARPRLPGVVWGWLAERFQWRERQLELQRISGSPEAVDFLLGRLDEPLPADYYADLERFSFAEQESLLDHASALEAASYHRDYEQIEQLLQRDAELPRTLNSYLERVRIRAARLFPQDEYLEPALATAERLLAAGVGEARDLLEEQAWLLMILERDEQATEVAWRLWLEEGEDSALRLLMRIELDNLHLANAQRLVAEYRQVARYQLCMEQLAGVLGRRIDDHRDSDDAEHQRQAVLAEMLLWLEDGRRERLDVPQLADADELPVYALLRLAATLADLKAEPARQDLRALLAERLERCLDDESDLDPRFSRERRTWHRVCAQAAAMLQRFELEARLWGRYCTLWPDAAKGVWLSWINAALNSGDDRCLQQAVSALPEQQGSLRQLALGYLSFLKGDDQGAASCAEAALLQAPDEFDGFGLLADIASRHQSLEGLCQVLDRLQGRVSPEEFRALCAVPLHWCGPKLLERLLQQGQLDELAHYRFLIQLQPEPELFCQLILEALDQVSSDEPSLWGRLVSETRATLELLQQR